MNLRRPKSLLLLFILAEHCENLYKEAVFLCFQKLFRKACRKLGGISARKRSLWTKPVRIRNLSRVTISVSREHANAQATPLWRACPLRHSTQCRRNVSYVPFFPSRRRPGLMYGTTGEIWWKRFKRAREYSFVSASTKRWAPKRPTFSQKTALDYVASSV